MLRFVIFPVSLALAFVAWVWACLFESVGVIQVVSSLANLPSSISHGQVMEFVRASSLAILAGAGFSLGFAIWDWKRNGKRDSSGHAVALRFLPNLGWCALYTIPICAFNALVFGLLMWTQLGQIFAGRATANSSLVSVLVALGFLPYLVNFVAIIWATTRSITQPDVLSPRVLRAKLGRAPMLRA